MKSDRPRVLVLAPFSNSALTHLKSFADVVYENCWETGKIQDPEELGRRLAAESFDAVVVESDFLFEETFAAAPRLRFAGICRAAVNQIDVEAATSRGLVVVNTPGRNADAVAEMAVGLMFALARRIPEADRYIRASRWQSPAGPYTSLRGIELSGRLVGVIGLGAIGRRVAGLCRAIGMTVLGHDPFVPKVEVETMGARPCLLDDLLRECDVVTLHAVPSEDGRPLLDAPRIARLKQGALFVNTASPALVDYRAIAEALRSGRLRGAAVDVFETHPVEPGHPLLGLENVILTPHIGGATNETVQRHSHMMVEDLRRFFDGDRPGNLVNTAVWDRLRAW
ncbi:MAG: D-glycerate dehydrogenase [Chloroflexi bacterium]|nr:D-glycerate dehydrogenase [Chloroflexota bacterium]